MMEGRPGRRSVAEDGESQGQSQGQPQQGQSISDVVFQAIRQDIILGQLAPSTKIRLEQASKRYSISVTSLREILYRLTAEDLVIAEGQRGFEVSPISRQELLELADLRILLEGHAIGLSFAAGDLEWEGRIVAAHHRLSAVERKLLAGDTQRAIEWVRCDWDFHHAIVSACRSTVLMQNLSSVFDRFLRYHMLAENFRGQPVADDHRLLFDLALSRDIETARTVAKRHVAAGVEHILKNGLGGLLAD